MSRSGNYIHVSACVRGEEGNTYFLPDHLLHDWGGSVTIPDWYNIKIHKNNDHVDGTWDADTILLAYRSGLLQGMDQLGSCRPELMVTKGQVAQILYNAGIYHAGDGKADAYMAQLAGEVLHASPGGK